MGVRTIAADRLERLTPVAHHIAELVNIAPDPHQPYVGASVLRPQGAACTPAPSPAAPDAYEHVAPDAVGNGTRFVVSRDGGPLDPGQLKAAELGPRPRRRRSSAEVLDNLKELEHGATTSRWPTARSSCLMRAATGWKQTFFRSESFRVITEQREDGAFVTEATVKVHVGDERVVATAEGNGPVNALDARPAQAPSAPSSPRSPTSI